MTMELWLPGVTQNMECKSFINISGLLEIESGDASSYCQCAIGGWGVGRDGWCLCWITAWRLSLLLLASDYQYTAMNLCCHIYCLNDFNEKTILIRSEDFCYLTSRFYRIVTINCKNKNDTVLKNDHVLVCTHFVQIYGFIYLNI